MICYATRRLHSILPCFRRIKRQDQCLYSLRKSNATREFSSSIPIIYRDDKYGELRNRLAEVPYLKMLEKEKDRFCHDLCYEKDERLRDVLKYYSKVFDYNSRITTNVSTAALLKAYCTYAFRMDDSTWDQWDSDRWRSAVILEWCVELLHAHHSMIDDIIDKSVFRRGQPCWYTKPDVGLRAIIDILFLRCGYQKVLEKHFAGSKCYMKILHEFLQANHNTLCGQYLDMMFNPKNRKPRFDIFTFEKYQALVEYKNSSIAFCLPVNLAMHLAGECSAKEFEFTRKLCSKLGMYFQMNDDYVDSFAKQEVTGEIGNDIAEGRCSWFSVKFLEVASEPMKKEFVENYGVDNKDAIANVVELFRKANLFEIFEETGANISADICHLIESKNDIKGAFFYDLFAQIQKLNFI